MKTKPFFILVLLASLFTTAASNAEIMNIRVVKEIDDDHIIVVTAKGDQLFLEKWTMKLSPFLFEDKVFSADVSPLWVTIFVEGKGEIKWSIEKHLGTAVTEPPKQSKQHSSPATAIKDGYPIEAAVNDELFIINGEKFKAKTYCLGWEQGEHVQFIEGSAFGACASAKLFNIERRQVCEVWCE